MHAGLGMSGYRHSLRPPRCTYLSLSLELQAFRFVTHEIVFLLLGDIRSETIVIPDTWTFCAHLTFFALPITH